MKELTDNPNIIVFIDEPYTLVGAGRPKALDAANISSRRSAARDRCIGATTQPNIENAAEKTGRAPVPGDQGRSAWRARPRDPARRQDRYNFHHVEYTREAIEAAVYQSSRYITDRFLPDKAIDLVDEAGARATEGSRPQRGVGEINKSIRVAVEHGARRQKDFERRSLPRAGSHGPREPSVRSRSSTLVSTRKIVVGSEMAPLEVDGGWRPSTGRATARVRRRAASPRHQPGGRLTAISTSAAARGSETPAYRKPGFG
jgi:ATP-dependent Clp protease ATP-binding subunit ClpC